MAETAKKVAEFVIDLLRSGEESKLLQTLQKMGADISFKPTPSGKDIMTTKELAKHSDLEVVPSAEQEKSIKFGSAALPEKPVSAKTFPRGDPRTTTINVKTGRVEDAGPGPDPVTTGGAPTTNPLEESVRSKEVIEGTTAPVMIEGSVAHTPKGEVIRRVTNPGIEQRLQQLKEEKILVSGDPRQRELLVKGATDSPNKLKDVPQSELEELAIQQRDAQAAANQAKYGKAVKVVKGVKLDRFGNPIKSKGGNPVDRTESPDEIFGEASVGLRPKGGETKEVTKGSTAIDVMLDDVLRSEKPPTKLDSPVGPMEAKLRKPTDLDLEGEEFDKGVRRVEDVLAKELTSDPLFPNPQHPRSATSQAIKSEARNTEINAEVQDVVARFKELFNVAKLKKANLKENKVASRLWDAWQKLSNNAAGARAGNEKALAVVRSIDDWLHKTAKKDIPDDLVQPVGVPSPDSPQRELFDLPTLRPTNPTMIDAQPKDLEKQAFKRGGDVSELGPP